MKNKISVGYDEIQDVLYVGIRDMNNSYGDEEPNGFVVHRDLETDALTGFTILDFKRIYQEGRVNDLPFKEVDFKTDILPLAIEECVFLQNQIQESKVV